MQYLGIYGLNSMPEILPYLNRSCLKLFTNILGVGSKVPEQSNRII